MENLKNSFVKEALLYERLEGEEVRCKTCERFCKISNGEVGFCKTRKNIEAKLYTIEYGNISSISANPIEKKPFFHFYPRSKALTIGSYSCNFSCPWCQNWSISKVIPKIKEAHRYRYISPDKFMRLLKEAKCQGTSISFNEPILLFEYSLDVFKRAKKEGYYNTYVTNGYMSKEALKILVEHGLDAMNVDVKGCEKEVKNYCGADINKGWRNVRDAKRMGIHVEITTLIIPAINDSEECLKNIASRIKKESGEDTPWHITQYYPAYKSYEYGLYNGRTPVEILENAWKIGKKEGLNYVYIGNVPGHPYENTYCPSCGELLIKRYSFDVLDYRIVDGLCHNCKERIPVNAPYEITSGTR